MLLSVVIPVFNEREALPLLLAALRPVLNELTTEHALEYELIFVDDGSRDGTADQLAREAAADGRIKVLSFSRNFGHQAAVTAGLDYAAGDAVVVMDADLQDPPAVLPELLTRYRQGFDVVSPQRVARNGDSAFKRHTASIFYEFMRRAVDERLTPEVGDFRLYSRRAVEALREFREQHRFVRGLVAWLGLSEAIVPFTRAPRSTGNTKYPTWKMLRFAWIAISSFSALPLKVCLVSGLGLTAIGLAYSFFVVYESLILRTTVPGWSSLVCLQLVFSGATLAAVGLTGDYVARIYEEVKGRPLYVLARTTNLPIELAPPRAVRLHERTPDTRGPEAPSPRESN